MSRSWSRSVTTGAASTPATDIPVTSASTRCEAARSRSVGALRSPVRRGPGHECEYGSRFRAMRPEMQLAKAETIGVLVVDDHEVVRRGLLAFLGSEPDIEVVGEAGGGAQALDLLASMGSEGRRPDVIVMDLQMAPIDGIESTRRVRALYDDIEVVALTSFAEDERVHAALQAGASGYLLKDSDADDVAAAVRAAHRGELQIDPVIARRLMASLRETRGHDPISELTSRELEVL